MGRKSRSCNIVQKIKKKTPTPMKIKPKITKAKSKPVAKCKVSKPKGKDKVQQKAVKALYSVDEKVLCYEPDPTKAKILYEAKVLQVVKTESRGKPVVECLIHFQGWNSSWDRFVSEDLILKDDETSRALQLKLAEEAEAMFQASANKSSKKRGRSIAELVRASLRGHGHEETEPKAEQEQSSGEEESAEEPDDDLDVELAIPRSIRLALDLDYFLINKYEKLTQLPAEPNIVQILEEYVRHFGLQQLVEWVDSVTASTLAECSNPQQAANKSSPSGSNGCIRTEDSKHHPMERLYNRLRVVKEVTDAIRIMIDFLLDKILLYSVEHEQFARCEDKSPTYLPLSITADEIEIGFRQLPEFQQPEVSHSPAKEKRGRGRSRAPAPTLPNENESANAQLRRLAVTMNPMIRDYKRRLLNWTLVPPSLYDRVPSLPSLIYGANFLLRLFVKLPEIWSEMTIPKRKLRIIIHYVEDMIEYFLMKRSFYGPHLYVPVKDALKRAGKRGRRPQFAPVVKVEQLSDEELEMSPDMMIKVEHHN